MIERAQRSDRYAAHGRLRCYTQLLDVFWRNVDPLTPNQQFCDKGAQYRSAIFYQDPEQRRLAEASKGALERSGRFEQPIVTEINPGAPFYPAEEEHQGYYRGNPSQGYCCAVIAPKVAKLRSRYLEKLAR